MDSADKFSIILESETNRLLSLCTKWQNILDTKSKLISEEDSGQILLAIGQTKLLISEKFKQFQNLVVDCKLGKGSRKILFDDLVGFWDLVMLQVMDVDRKFIALDHLMNNISKDCEKDKLVQVEIH